jgi:hypothetical protein
MAEARKREQWAHTSLACCLIANANRDAKKRREPFTPNDFTPYPDKRRAADRNIEVGIDILKAFVPGAQW